jgi:uncharacterized membrane protein YhiD involved in acid resistance
MININGIDFFHIGIVSIAVLCIIGIIVLFQLKKRQKELKEIENRRNELIRRTKNDSNNTSLKHFVDKRNIHLESGYNTVNNSNDNTVLNSILLMNVLDNEPNYQENNESTVLEETPYVKQTVFDSCSYDSHSYSSDSSSSDCGSSSSCD